MVYAVPRLGPDMALDAAAGPPTAEPTAPTAVLDPLSPDNESIRTNHKHEKLLFAKMLNQRARLAKITHQVFLSRMQSITPGVRHVRNVPISLYDCYKSLRPGRPAIAVSFALLQPYASVSLGPAL